MTWPIPIIIRKARRTAVAAGQTVLDFRGWLAMQAQRLAEDMGCEETAAL